MIVAIAQMNTHAGDFGATVSRMKTLAENAADQGADLIVFPTPCLTGQEAQDFPNWEGFQLDLLQALDQLSRGLACPALVPFYAEQDGDPYREVVLLKDGSAIPLHMGAYEAEEQYVHESQAVRKTIPPQEEPLFIASFELGGMKCAVAQSYGDLDDLLDCNDSYDVVFYMPGYGYALDDVGSVLGAALGESRFKADATSLEAWLVAVGAVGGYGLQVYTGSSFVMSPQGNLVASAPAFEEYLLLADVSSGQHGSAESVRPEHSLEPELYNKPLHLWQALTLGLHDYFQKQSRTKAALLLDGSLKSCILAALVSDALGPKNVYALLGGSVNERRAQMAQQVAKSLHLEVVASPIDSSLKSIDSSLRADMAQACLAEVARDIDAVPLSGEDKTYLSLEVTSAVCRVAELLPFGDVYRSDLIELGHMRNTISPIIPADAFEAYEVPDLSGLDEAEPTPEARLRRVDATLAMHIEWERSLGAVAARQGEPELCEEVMREFEEREALRRSLPMSLVASTRPLADVRVPLCFSWHDRVRSEDERAQATNLARRFLRPAHTPESSLPAPPDLSGLMKGLEVELRGGSLPKNVDQGMVESALGELMGLLQDISGGERPSVEGPFGPFAWGSPFSEN